MSKFNLFLLFVLSSFLVTSCDPEQPVLVNEEEVITTLTFTLTPKGGGTAVTLKFNDPDGDGGIVPTIVGGTLQKAIVYDCSVTLLNEIDNPIVNITDEVLKEALDHQFFYAWTSELQNSIAMSYTDEDAGKKPIGIKTELTTKVEGKGLFRITLRHKPNKSGVDVINGIIANAGGETDIEVEFPLEVK